MKILAIIPARSGSKGLKDKNIIDLCGKPLMAYSIEAALQSGCFDRIVVSTDSERYAEIAKAHGADVMMRGEALSNDKATSFMVIEDILHRTADEAYDYFVLLQPTSPLRTAKHITEALDSFEKQMDKFDFLVSMKKSEFGEDLVKVIEEDMSLKHFDKDFSNYRRQSYSFYSPNGAIFAAKCEKYLQRKHFFGAKSLAYVMSDLDSVDIDNYIDYKLAEIILKENGTQI